MCVAALFAALSVTGCAFRLTAGFASDVLAKVNGDKISMASLGLLMAESKYAYENLFDTGVWNESLGDFTTEEYVKASAKDTLMHLEYLKLMAEDMRIAVSESDKKRIDEAAKQYWGTLPDSAAANAKFDMDTVREFYGNLLLAEKVFYDATSDVDTEVSVDEARVIDVQYIFISTMTADGGQDAVKMPESERRKKAALAQNVLTLTAENDFVMLAGEYSDDTVYSLQFGSGEKDADFEKAAFALEMGKISDIVETEYGYYIIKCINDNVESNYDRRRAEIILARRTKEFAGLYSDYVSDIITEFNDKAYDGLSVENAVSGSGMLYDIYLSEVSVENLLTAE